MLNQGDLSRLEAMKWEQYLRRVELSKLPAVTQPGSWLCHTQLWPGDAVSRVREVRALSEYLWAAGRYGALDWQLCRHWWKWKHLEKVLLRPERTDHFFHQIEIREELPISCCFPEWRKLDHYQATQLIHLTAVIWLKSAVFPSWATYGASVSSGLSVAVPKYFFPAAVASVLSWQKTQGRIASSTRQCFMMILCSSTKMLSVWTSIQLPFIYKSHSEDNPEIPWELQVIWHDEWESSSSIE